MIQGAKMLLTVSGPAGSGKTTLSKLLSERLSLPLISTGTIFRRMAEEHGMDVLSFNLFAENRPEIDMELDRRVVEEAKRNGSCIVEGRIACQMLKRSFLSPFCIYLTAEEIVRARRIVQREGGDVAEVLEQMRKRGESERKRYMNFYGINVDDTSVYDIVLDSTHLSPEELCSRVLKALEVN